MRRAPAAGGRAWRGERRMPGILALTDRSVSSACRTRERVVHEIRKDLVRSTVEALRRHLPESAAELPPA